MTVFLFKNAQNCFAPPSSSAQRAAKISHRPTRFLLEPPTAEQSTHPQLIICPSHTHTTTFSKPSPSFATTLHRLRHPPFSAIPPSPSNMASTPVQVLNPDGELAAAEEWFPNSTADLPTDPFLVVAITGPQASGKSTLANALFSTNFPIANRGSVGMATTRGILSSRPSDTPTPALVLDVEGADARARGRDAKVFAAMCAAFVSAVADVVIVNLWFHDACRLDSAAYSLLRTILKTSAQGLVDGAPARTALVVAVRDTEEDPENGLESIREMIKYDIGEIWADIALETGLPVGEGGTSLEDLIDLHVFMFPHIRHQSTEFQKRVNTLKEALYSGEIAKPEHSKQIPADGFPMYATTLWDSITAGGAELVLASGSDGVGDRKADDFYSGEDFAIVAAYRCDEVFSLKLADASTDIGDMLDMVEAGNRIDDLGQKCDAVVDRALQEYDVETSDYADEPVYERKRTELEAIIDTGLMSVYMKNVAIIAREALASFKASLSDDMPADFALYTADAMFVKQAKEGLRKGSSWTYRTEQVDLHNMMTEIAAQQRKLVDTQVNASQQQSKAMHFLRIQHAQMQAVQQQAMGGAVGQWNLGAAYRPPDSNVNLSLAYQQGRTNLQISMVPDESATLLGPTGFTAGVGPGNLGMSFNVNF